MKFDVYIFTAQFVSLKTVSSFAPIEHLLTLRSPSNVSRLVVAVVVDAVDGVLVARPRPYVIEEFLK
jgi:hypothetical protein